MRFFSAVLLVAILGMFSCSEDFQIGSGYKDVTIMWSILDKTDTATYIKLNKGFFDEKANNILYAQNPDSIYYSNADVYLEELSVSNAVVNSYKLNKVDANLEGYMKDSGTFAQSPNWAYKTKQPLKGGTKYQVRMVNLDNGKTVYGQTTVLDDDPNEFNVQNLFSFFARDYANPDTTQVFRWSVPKGAATSDGYIRFHYVEQVPNNPGYVQKYFDIPIFKNVQVSSGVVSAVEFQNASLYAGIASNLDIAKNGLVRYVDTADYVFYCGGEEIKQYILVANAQGGITSDQIKPYYTNLKGEKAFGLVSSRVKKIYYAIPFTQKTIDQIKVNTATKNLGFFGVSPI